MATLSKAELQKRNNFNIFINRIKFEKPFKLNDMNGAEVILNKEYSKILNSVNSLDKLKSGQAILLETKSGDSVRLTQLYKDSEFSGRTQATTAKEDAEVISLNKQLDKIKDSLGTDKVPVKVGNTVYNVTLCESTPGTPKCDFHFLGPNGYVGHISHKAGAGPRGFQQWAGTSQRVEPTIFAHPETQAFIDTLKAMYPNGMPSGTTVGRKIVDAKLKNLAVYGKDYSKNGKKGENNVDTTVQGNLKLVKRGNNYVLTASSHENKNGSLVSGSYDPIFLGVYKGDRSDHGIKGARITINPIGGRSVKQWV